MTSTDSLPSFEELQRMIGRFAPVEIAADVSGLPAGERVALSRLVRAARVMDALFLRQVWAGNDAMLQQLARDAVATRGGAELAAARLRYFLMNKGPWSRLDHNRAFVPGAPPKPEGAHFYPADATKEEIEHWIEALPPEQRAHAAGFFTTIRRDPGNQLVAVPYSSEYAPDLAHAAALLREAAALTSNRTLEAYLASRAAALLSNDYYDSDVAWMELEATIEPTIGPYEVYEDEWFNYKAAFEAFITIRDDTGTRKLASFSNHLQAIEDALPINAVFRNARLGALSPIRVVNVVITAGDANSGVQTAAFNLPNDERVVHEKGAKRVMLKNVQEAKFRHVLAPIADVVLDASARGDVAFDAFFTHILMHELMHGLGPHNISVGGRRTTVRQELKETYSAIEEVKADISGLWALRLLADRKHLAPDIVRTMYPTFVASAFRSIRFGINEAHGKGVAVQLNHFLDSGAVRVAPDGRFGVVPDRIADAVTSLTAEIMTLQAEGSHAKAEGVLDRLGVIRPEVRRMVDRLTHVPVDIEPTFTTALAL